MPISVIRADAGRASRVRNRATADPHPWRAASAPPRGGGQHDARDRQPCPRREPLPSPTPGDMHAANHPPAGVDRGASARRPEAAGDVPIPKPAPDRRRPGSALRSRRVEPRPVRPPAPPPHTMGCTSRNTQSPILQSLVSWDRRRARGRRRPCRATARGRHAYSNDNREDGDQSSVPPETSMR